MINDLSGPNLIQNYVHIVQRLDIILTPVGKNVLHHKIDKHKIFINVLNLPNSKTTLLLKDRLTLSL